MTKKISGSPGVGTGCTGGNFNCSSYASWMPVPANADQAAAAG